MSISLVSVIPHAPPSPDSPVFNDDVRSAEAGPADTFERVPTASTSEEIALAAIQTERSRVGARIGVAVGIGAIALFFISPIAAAITSVCLLAGAITYALVTRNNR